MEPAQTIVNKLGGPSVVAKIANVHRTRVSNWMRPKEAGGTGGVIPFKHVPSLLAAAKAKDVVLEVSDFLPRPAETESAA